MPPPSEPPPRNPGTVIITPRGENAEASPRAVSENIYRIAQQKMAAGDYAGAIRDFLTALNGSDKPALIHQLLGRCYKNLKEVAKAREHFEKAISLYESAARAGSEEAKAAMEACRKELQSLGG
jgi:tetratricopeptide (TPR) repeat protein